jgi:hypothetical protein
MAACLLWTRRSVPRAPAQGPAGSVLREPACLDDLELLAIFQALPRSSARRAAPCEVLVARYAGLVRSCAMRYRRGGEPTGDPRAFAGRGLPHRP